MPEWTTGLPPDVVEEITQHLADVRRMALIQGKSAEEADRLVAAEVENVGAIAATIQRRRKHPPDLSASGGHAWAGVGRDVRHAVRLLAAKRGYTTILVLTLASGIGLCTAVFSLISSLLLAPLPYDDADRLVLVWETPAGDPSRHFVASEPNYREWREETRSFESLALWESLTFNLAAAADPARVGGLRASASLFDVLRIRPALGRAFRADEEAPGHDIAVISDAIWRVHLGADPDVIGRAIRLNGRAYEVIGVLPPGVEFPNSGAGVWIPLALRPEETRGWHSFMVAGRLAPDVTFDQAKDEVERLGATMRERYAENANEGATVERMGDYGVASIERILVMLSAAVALVLLIACVNAASLQLAFGVARRREFVTRLALGARYGHIVRQVFVESLAIASLACVAGVTVAAMAIRGVDLFMSRGFRTLPFRGEVDVTLDANVMLFAVGVTAISATIFGFAPLAGLRKAAVQPVLRASERGTTGAAAGLRRVLVTIEVALAIVVLCGAGLMVRSLSTLLQVDAGIDPRNVLTTTVSLPQADPHGAPERQMFCANLARETAAIPGVVTASAVSDLPLSGSNSDRILSLEGRPDPPPGEDPYFANYRVACGNYFATLGIPLLAGRDFGPRDTLDSEPVVIVNQAFAKQYFDGKDVLNRRIKLGRVASEQPWLRVIGVVDDVRHFGLDAAPAREIFRPYSQAATPAMTVVAKTATDPLNVARPLRDALTRAEPQLPAGPVRTMEEIVELSVGWRQTPMRLLTGFAAVGLLLAALGVYGVLAYYVSQRTREFGVRVALGASRAALVMLVLRQTAVPVGAGVALGIFGSAASGRLLADLLYEVRPGDPAVITTIVAILVGVALLAGLVPARRAARVNPVVALRDE